MLNVENLAKAYGSQVLFRNANFLIGEQARVGAVGPNGSGKTTFFRILVGEEHADEGQVRKPKNYRIALMQQEWTPHAHDTVLEAALREHQAWYKCRERLRRVEGSLGSEPDAQRLAEYQRIETEYTALGGYHVEQTAQELLSGLGFSVDQFGRPCKELSGGWRIRVHMAGLLLQQADLLLLDEPTNHLDVESVLWFEDFLRAYPHSVVLISHDRRLMERFATEILEFAPPTLSLWPGNLKKFEGLKTARIEQLEAEISNKEREIERLKEFIDRFRAKATKARQAQNRLKTADFYEEQIRELRAKMPVVSRRPSRFRLHPDRRLPRVVIDMQQSSIGYQKSHPLFSIDRCVIEAGKKIGVIGVNGVGKTTFLKSCAGELKPLAGRLKRNEDLTLGYFAQHRMEELKSSVKTVDYLYGGGHGNTIPQVRGVAAALGLTENDLDKPIDVLSGGEKARVSLTRILLSRPGLLLLDEPTNHLDIEACDALVRGLAAYEGTVLVVSHNRDFLDSLVNMILEIKPGHALFHHGNYSDWLARHVSPVPAKAVGPSEFSQARKDKDQKRREAKDRQKRFQSGKELRKKIADVEKEMKLRNEERTQLDAFLCGPEAPKDAEFGSKLKRRSQLDHEIETIETEWLKLVEKRDALEDA
ncbi:MAG: ABC-F family ATP-binding cassette domain-containing protein [Pseudomonadota bacterium]